MVSNHEGLLFLPSLRMNITSNRDLVEATKELKDIQLETTSLKVELNALHFREERIRLAIESYKKRHLKDNSLAKRLLEYMQGHYDRFTGREQYIITKAALGGELPEDDDERLRFLAFQELHIVA